MVVVKKPDREKSIDQSLLEHIEEAYGHLKLNVVANQHAIVILSPRKDYHGIVLCFRSSSMVEPLLELGYDAVHCLDYNAVVRRLKWYFEPSYR